MVECVAENYTGFDKEIAMLPRLPHIGPFFRSNVNRNNFWLGVANGVVFNAVEALTEPYVVLTLFVSMLTSSKFLIGLIAPLRVGSWFLPQLLISDIVQRQPRKMPIYTLVGVFRVVGWTIAALLLWFVRDPVVLLIGFFVMVVLTRLAEGVTGLAFMDIIGKAIPPYRRGSFFGARQLGGGILALGTSAMVGVILSQEGKWVFPHQFAVLFTVYTVVIAGAIYLFTRVKEPEEPLSPRLPGIGRQMQRAYHLLEHNPIYQRFLIARILMVTANMALPFYVIYAREQLQAPVGLTGLYLTTMTLAALISNVWAARVSDRAGNRLLLLISCLVGVLAPALALLLGWRHASPVWFALVFALNGTYNASSALAHNNFLLDVAPAGDRPIYVGMANTLVGVGIVASSAGGALAEWLGVNILFWVALVTLTAAIFMVSWLQEPRMSGKRKLMV